MLKKLSWRILAFSVLGVLILSALIGQWAHPYAASHPQVTGGAEHVFVPLARFFTADGPPIEAARVLLWDVLIAIVAVVLHRKSSRNAAAKATDDDPS